MGVVDTFDSPVCTMHNREVPPPRWEPLSGPAAELVATTAQHLLHDPAELFAATGQAILDALPVVDADADLAASARATSNANITRWLVTMARYPGEPVGTDLTPEALEIARDVIRRGLDREVLWTGYRQGQNTSWLGWMRTLCTMSAGKPEWSGVLGEALDATARSYFGFLDDILVNVEAQVSLERDQLRSDGTSMRLETVRLILDGAPITQERAAKRLGYELAAQHIGFVLWADGEVDQGSLEKTANQLARAAGAGRPLALPVSGSSLWAWSHAPSPLNLRALRDAVTVIERPIHVAIGASAYGMAGFGLTHRQAIDARKLAQRLPEPPRFTSYEDIEVVVLASVDPDRVRHFLQQTLGGLMGERREIRETMLAYLRHERNATSTAKELFTHRNTVLNRLARAESLLPRPSSERPLAVHLALELDHWLAAQPNGE
ncbi:PucR family transcriptional regulator [Amycolatopsis jiangsuensis]|uniref:DNA-binding PucR family transcriptional regulator n=1 Tax=Amycolatopsis jiangsuensis TaxID=1181879 RepID=A0A840J7C5_9PSEU|nr:helix-turn-helix domain-containing protein [Amycolatopsis jiangsuensis]MBB4689683.1 DNA-binding PucR family transcriptional regulator [Amycolatopsis jiangsuensis]